MKIHYGMAQWQHPAWMNWLYPSSLPASERLGRYSDVFPTVEVGSTFYASLSQTQLQRWYEMVNNDFRFCFKVPQEITHRLEDHPWRELTQDWLRFMELLSPFQSKLGPAMLQFPSSCAGEDMEKILSLCELWSLEVPLSVEVRHLSFFDKGRVEKGLLANLSRLGVNRVVMDSRPVFSTSAYCESLIDAQKKKPRVPCHPIATAQHPVVRFIGHPDLSLNEVWLDQWALKLSQWLKEGLQPFVFVHSSDNIAAPTLAASLDGKVRRLIPSYQPALQLPNSQEQIALW